MLTLSLLFLWFAAAAKANSARTVTLGGSLFWLLLVSLVLLLLFAAEVHNARTVTLSSRLRLPLAVQRSQALGPSPRQHPQPNHRTEDPLYQQTCRHAAGPSLARDPCG